MSLEKLPAALISLKKVTQSPNISVMRINTRRDARGTGFAYAFIKSCLGKPCAYGTINGVTMSKVFNNVFDNFEICTIYTKNDRKDMNMILMRTMNKWHTQLGDVL